MYKIYINEKPLFLVNSTDLGGELQSIDSNIISRYRGRAKFLLNHIDLLEKTTDTRPVIVYTNDLDKLWTDFKNLYHIIKAAGGLVYNPDGEVLAIFRRDYWDLPKGKIDKGEKKRTAAIREVMEETGLQNVEISHKLMTTWHTYRDPRKNRRVLKKTFWYRMTAPKQQLVPQAEEDIEQAVWMRLSDLKNCAPIYNTILEVLERD